MKCSIICAIVIISSFNCCCAKELPSFIQKCKRVDPVELNKCLLQRAEGLLPKLIQGIPELKLPPIEPLHIPKLELHTGAGASVGFNAVFKDLVVYGGKSLQVKEMNFDLENKHIFLHLVIPKLHIQGPYSFDGKVLLFQLSSTGMSNINITDIDSTSHMNISIVTRHNKQYIDLGNDYKIIRKYGKVSLYFEDLFKDNPQLTETTNKAINDNIKEIGKEITPLLDDSVHSLIVGIIKPVFDDFSLDELFD